LGHIPEGPYFDIGAVTKNLRRDGFQVEQWLTHAWRDGEDFLAKRCGLTEKSGSPSNQSAHWSKRLGLDVNQPDENVVQLYQSVVVDGKWPPAICDLSEETTITPQVFPCRNPTSVVSLSRSKFGYVVSIRDRVTRPWKLLISDQLSVVQIEREGWCCDGNNLVLNLIKKGIPFEVLHERSFTSGPFRSHPGPIVHPDGKEPRVVDYLAYRQDLADVLRTYPHVRAAGLCTGGIAWRVCMDALPLPSEAQVVGPFHRNACISREIEGTTYWTPRLTHQEEMVVVGVYKWADSK